MNRCKGLRGWGSGERRRGPCCITVDTLVGSVDQLRLHTHPPSSETTKGPQNLTMANPIINMNLHYLLSNIWQSWSHFKNVMTQFTGYHSLDFSLLFWWLLCSPVCCLSPWPLDAEVLWDQVQTYCFFSPYLCRYLTQSHALHIICSLMNLRFKCLALNLRSTLRYPTFYITSSLRCFKFNTCSTNFLFSCPNLHFSFQAKHLRIIFTSLFQSSFISPVHI